MTQIRIRNKVLIINSSALSRNKLVFWRSRSVDRVVFRTFYHFQGFSIIWYHQCWLLEIFIENYSSWKFGMIQESFLWGVRFVSYIGLFNNLPWTVSIWQDTFDRDEVKKLLQIINNNCYYKSTVDCPKLDDTIM